MWGRGALVEVAPGWLVTVHVVARLRWWHRLVNRSTIWHRHMIVPETHHLVYRYGLVR